MSLCNDSLCNDSLYNDSLGNDSLYNDSLCNDSLYNDSLYNDSLCNDSLCNDSAEFILGCTRWRCIFHKQFVIFAPRQFFVFKNFFSLIFNVFDRCNRWHWLAADQCFQTLHHVTVRDCALQTILHVLTSHCTNLNILHTATVNDLAPFYM